MSCIRFPTGPPRIRPFQAMGHSDQSQPWMVWFEDALAPNNSGIFLWLCPNSSSLALQCDSSADYLHEVFGSGHDFAHKLPWTCPSLQQKATTPLKATREPENHPLCQTRIFYVTWSVHICTLLNRSTESARPNCFDSILASLSCAECVHLGTVKSSEWRIFLSFFFGASPL